MTEPTNKASLSYIKLANLVKNPENPRQSNPKDLGYLVDSIRKNGFIVPMIVKKTEEEGKFLVLDGNHRLEVSKLLDIEEVPVYVLPDGITKKQEVELIFLLNRTFAEFDKDKAKNVLKDFSELVNKVDFDRLGITFMKPSDFVDDNPVEVEPEVKDMLSKIENLKGVVEKIIRDGAKDIKRNYLVFEARKNRYLVIVVDDEQFAKLDKLQRDKSGDFKPFVVGKILST